jgi:hypothetical protein
MNFPYYFELTTKRSYGSTRDELKEARKKAEDVADPLETLYMNPPENVTN